MANTDLAQSQATHSNESRPHEGACRSSPKPHFMTGIHPLGVTIDNTVCGLNSTLSSTPAAGLAPPSAQRQTHGQANSTALEQYRLQLYNYALNIERLRCPQYGTGAVTGSGSVSSPWLHPYSPLHCAGAGIGAGVGNSRMATLSTISLFPHSQRIFQPEEPKPQHSYIGLIAMAILSSSEIKLVLSDIYQYILDNYPYFRTRGPGWRNSIRHNLSLNDCFIKSGRSANGKGHYWAIHPANMDDFRKGDFRRRKAQRKVRKHMGLSVDDASTDSPSPPPLDLTTPPPLGTAQASFQLAALNYPYHQHYIGQFFGRSAVSNLPQYATNAASLQRQQVHLQQHPEQHTLQALDPIYQQPQNQQHHQHQHQHIAYINSTTTTTIANLYSQTRKRQFDVASLLAPDVQIVDIVEDEEGSSPAATRTTTQTQHTVITKVQVQKQQTIHHELVLEPPSSGIKANHQLDADPEADIDVDGDCDGDRDRDRDKGSDWDENVDKEVKSSPEKLNHHFIDTPADQSLRISPEDNISYLSDTRRLSFDADVEDQEHNNFSASISPVLGGSSLTSSSQHDSNSLEECPLDSASSAVGPISLSSTSAMGSPLAVTMSLPKAYIELNHVDPHILSRYYGSYMAAAARRANMEASRAQSKSMTTPPPKELLPNKL